MTLQANSTFLPVLDDLLSPDFRPVLLPAQTPQTPTDMVSFGGGKIITNAFGNITFTNNKGGMMSTNKIGNGQTSGQCGPANVDGNSLKMNKTLRDCLSETSDSEAATKIQNWWKSKRSNSFDVRAERIKHSIRHSRTEDHIRYLEAEVSRLKSALSSERKIRSLQLEAIRSLWSQVQKISTVDPSTGASSSLMTRSVPNGLTKDLKDMSGSGCGTNQKAMSMSMNAAFENEPSSLQSGNIPCSCTKEVQNLRESLTLEMSQLRAMIDQLTSSAQAGERKESMDGKPTSVIVQENFFSTNTTNTSQTQESEEPEENKEGCDSDNSGQQHQHKRPFSLNLISSHATTAPGNDENTVDAQEKKTTEEEKEQIVDYAMQMATKLMDDAIEVKE